uniref:Uncharacterized protein n=1 Tax=Amazona collaria TaxID=241587 RepID=A0A8B9F5G7_9PSIT
MTNAPDSPYLKLAFSFHYRGVFRKASVKVESFSHVGVWFICVCLVDLDDTEKNEKLKFSIVMRLPEALGQKIRQVWNHPINANLMARKYVKLLLEKLENRQCIRFVPERLSVPVEFLPLNYLTSMLAEIENQGVQPHEKQDHVNVRFVEETALKHTMTLLGLKYS